MKDEPDFDPNYKPNNSDGWILLGSLGLLLLTVCVVVARA